MINLCVCVKMCRAHRPIIFISIDTLEESPRDKPPVAAARRRSGTGRKLPTPPVGPKSGSTTPNSNRNLTELISPRSGAPVYTSFDPLPEGTVVSDVMSDTNAVANGCDSRQSMESMDTDTLLRDTEHVMKVMTERMSRNGKAEKPGSKKLNRPPGNTVWRKHSDLFIPINDESDSDASSTFAVVNGHAHSGTPKGVRGQKTEIRKPPKSSPRESSRDKWGGLPERGYKQTVMRTKSNKRSSLPHIEMDSSFEMHSESETSIISSTSEFSETTASPKLSRKDRIKQSKSPISLAKTNRAFALRRARLDSNDTETTPRSDMSRSSPRPDMSRSSPRSDVTRSRPGSAGSVKSRPVSAGRSEATSLGGQIVKKSRDNSRDMRAKSAGPMSRGDISRYNNRSSKNASPSTAKLSKTPDPKLSNSRGSLRLSANKPNSRSNSPQSEEYSAWKRRKSYDPRKAVASAKAKAKESKTVDKSLSVGSTGSSEWVARSIGNDLMSTSMSSEEADSFLSEDVYQDEIPESERVNELSRMSSAITREVGELSRNIEEDDVITGADASLVSRSRSSENGHIKVMHDGCVILHVKILCGFCNFEFLNALYCVLEFVHVGFMQF